MTSPHPVETPTDRPDLSVVVVSWNTSALLRECLASIGVHLKAIDHEIVVVDNASSDDSADMVATGFPSVHLLRNPDNRGFGVANNQGMLKAKGRWLLLLNSDAALTDGSVAALVSRVRDDPRVGLAHCRLRLPDGRLQHSVYRFPSLRLALLEDLGLRKLMPSRRAGELLLGAYWDYTAERDVDWVAGAFMLLPREVFVITGGFDEQLFMYGEDLEWCHRIRTYGWTIRFFPQAELLHRDHASADLRFGSEREALCELRRQDFYVFQHGRIAGAAYLSVRLVGAALRVLYYRLRGSIGGPGAANYRDMRPNVDATFRAVLGAATGRR